MGDFLRTLALMISLLLLGCMSPTERGVNQAAPASASRTAVTAGQQITQNAQPRPSCMPSDGGGIICQ
jgi:hypothetical protein